MASKNILMFLSSVRPERAGDRVSNYVQKRIKAQGLLATVIDPKKLPIEHLSVPYHFMENPEKNAPTWMKTLNKDIINADGFLILSTEYNSTIPPPLTNLMDHFPPTSYRHRPCGIITYAAGIWGGCRVMIALRSYAVELGMLPIPNAVPIPNVLNSFTPNGDPLEDIASTAIKKLVSDLDWYADAIKNQKKRSPIE